ncbi:MAG TPA: sigma-70 family RNA polymerase sigma factor [Candidatus Acidoferrum sp.]|nr:sigma-70 family RNA polymerase sigma factor [Candidatus Acidoferrum sp.]
MKEWTTAESPADADLVLAARNGDRVAFGALYERYARMVHGILLSRLPASEVDDLVQDVFLRAMPRLGHLRDTTRFGPWIAAIARNQAKDRYRKMRAQGAVTQTLSNNEEERTPSNSLPDPQAATVMAIIQSLSTAYRETLILRLVEGLTGPEIAARTGLTHGSVRVNLFRGMKQLREKLSRAPSRDYLPAPQSLDVFEAERKSRDSREGRKKP